jgi:hypothetical protein
MISYVLLHHLTVFQNKIPGENTREEEVLIYIVGSDYLLMISLDVRSQLELISIPLPALFVGADMVILR